jgi:uncharacterized membrane protein
MPELLRHVFGWVCGQDPAHTWSPGDELLPLCQRCTGVYAGAFVAALLHLAWRPLPTPRWLWLNGAFLLSMLPFGFYWIPQNAELRCASGILFGFGLVAFLWLTLPEQSSRSSQVNEAQTEIVNRKPQIINVPESPSAFASLQRDKHVGSYIAFAASLIAVLALTPLLAENGNAIVAGVLMVACTGGALALAALLLANLFFFLDWLAKKTFARAT